MSILEGHRFHLTWTMHTSNMLWTSLLWFSQCTWLSAFSFGNYNDYTSHWQISTFTTSPTCIGYDSEHPFESRSQSNPQTAETIVLTDFWIHQVSKIRLEYPSWIGGRMSIERGTFSHMNLRISSVPVRVSLLGMTKFSLSLLQGIRRSVERSRPHVRFEKSGAAVATSLVAQITFRPHAGCGANTARSGRHSESQIWRSMSSRASNATEVSSFSLSLILFTACSQAWRIMHLQCVQP